jgi:hypothetical protein
MSHAPSMILLIIIPSLHMRKLRHGEVK